MMNVLLPKYCRHMFCLSSVVSKLLLLQTRILLFIVLCFATVTYADIGTDQANTDFDHLSTGFFLSPAHQNVECSECHVRGVFKGTPTACDGCHNSATVITALGKNPGHIDSTGDCEECHGESGLNWVEMNFKTHDAVMGDCAGCHNDNIAIGKSKQHIPSDDECEVCHLSTSTYTVGVFDHSGTTANCYSCHDGNHSGTSTASARHMQSTTTCESCHNALTKDWYSIVGVDHSDVILGTCDDCHSVANAVGPVKNNQHFPSNDECDDCHNTFNFDGALFDHGGTTTNCFSCHDGNHDDSGAYTLSPTHMVSSNTCESCHNALTKDWYSIIGIDHSDVIQGTCESCHVGRRSYGTTKISGHISSSNTCDNCHFDAGVMWAGAVDQEAAPLNVAVAAAEAENLIAESENIDKSIFIHAEVTENCLSCHNGSDATGKKINHLPTTDSCESCHQIGSWSPVNHFNHDAAMGVCSSCHNGSLASGQMPNHINTLKMCDDCHREDSWTPVVRVDHASTLGNCFSCHNRKIAEGKPLNHISSDNNCDNCHVTHIWSQVAMDHSNVTGSCALCHNGRSAPAKPVNHIASNNTCNDCHRRRAWTPVYRVDHLAVIGSCTSCHNGRMADGKSANHPSTHNNCEDCHRSNLWSHVTFNHNNVSGTCLSCHIGDYKQKYHKKTQQANAIYYSANELVDCAGSCHIYQDQTFSTISIRRPGPDHRPRRGAW